MSSNYKSGLDRNQVFISSLNDFIDENNVARIIDAFVDTLDISNFMFSSTSLKGNRPYNPRTLLKVYLLGYYRNIRSSRKLEYALSSNVEFMWISNNLRIKHTTISDFRKNNHPFLKQIMIDFNLNCKNLNLISTFDSTDGTKIRAVNSKDKNFTLNKIDDRINRIKSHIDEYENAFDSEDINDDLNDELKNKIDEYNSKLDELDNLRRNMLDNNLSQISLTDPQSKLMRNNGKFDVCYNNQVCVDMKTHIVKDFLLNNNPADLGVINSVSSSVKDIYGFDIVTNVTDKGYNDRTDMMNCLENGIIPQVTPSRDKNEFTLETNYEEAVITDEELNSTKKEDIKKCIRAGVIPNVYKDVINTIEVKEIIESNYIDTEDNDSMSLDEKRDFAIQNECFVRDIKCNIVYCPMGETLRQKSTNSGKIRYANKHACKCCKNPCTTAKCKTVDFANNQKLSGKNVNNSRQKKSKKLITKVILTIKPNKELLKKRMATSEHPHASMKFWDNSGYLLTKGIDKAIAEIALYYCAYNIRRAINLIGAKELIEYFKQKKANIKPILSKINFFINIFTKSYNN